jgi:hypothetical protein
MVHLCFHQLEWVIFVMQFFRLFFIFFLLLARIYTILLDSADVMLLTNFIVSTFLSSAVFAAVLYYKQPQKPKAEWFLPTIFRSPYHKEWFCVFSFLTLKINWEISFEFLLSYTMHEDIYCFFISLALVCCFDVEWNGLVITRSLFGFAV